MTLAVFGRNHKTCAAACGYAARPGLRWRWGQIAQSHVLTAPEKEALLEPLAVAKLLSSIAQKEDATLLLMGKQVQHTLPEIP